MKGVFSYSNQLSLQHSNVLLTAVQKGWGQSGQQVVLLITQDFVRTWGKLHWKCDGTRAETRFRLSAKRTNQFKSAGASVQSTTDSRGVHNSGSNAGYTMFRGSMKSTGYLLHSPVSPSLPLPFVTVCRHISTGLYDTKTLGLFSRPAKRGS
jgi:hypothetical protein